MLRVLQELSKQSQNSSWKVVFGIMAIDEIASPTSSVLSQHQGSHLKSTGREHGSESCSIDAKVRRC